MRASARVQLWFVAATCLTGVALPAYAASWEEQGLNCLVAFNKPADSNEKTLIGCADAFGTSAKLDRLNPRDRKSVENGLRWMVENGSDAACAIAREALLRLDIKLPARAPKPTTGPVTNTPNEPKRYDPPEAKTADREAAEKLVKDGIALNKKKKWQDGEATLKKALEKDPRSEAALYNLACAEANQAEGHAGAIRHLGYLADLGTETATGRLIKARTDADFDGVRDDPEFKRVTGAVRVQVVNTIGSPGEAAVENLETLLVKLDQRKPDAKDDDSAPLDHPVIQFKPHAKAQVGLLADLMNHPRVELQPIAADSPGKYDIVIRWGAKVTVNADGKKTAESIGPETVDEQVAAARRKQNKVLAQPEQAINKVNRVVDTPGRTYTEAENMGKRVTNTVDKAKGAAEKVKGLTDKLNKL